ncbi:tail fiber assembly protein [Photorhabdus temperata]|uniref:tail fiber assembly protein n=1 Tax=Photorhabdus temperata TaxID=574560 RepID=UPI0021D50BFA|nr:tail fiber assembly protein [Photorhabdus temperata]MCT8350023.1 tail fiber assembly protein [Photorhabdus temperata]
MKTSIFTPYIPKDGVSCIQYLTDDEGNDWYQIQEKFLEETIKFTFDKNGVITSMSKDVSSLFPIYLSVAELTSEAVPTEINITGGWVFDGKKIIPRIYTLEEQRQQIENQKSEKMIAANVIIQPLQDAIDLGIATNEEKKLLLAWKRYRVLLSRIDTSLVSEINWPEKPA